MTLDSSNYSLLTLAPETAGFSSTSLVNLAYFNIVSSTKKNV